MNKKVWIFSVFLSSFAAAFAYTSTNDPAPSAEKAKGNPLTALSDSDYEKDGLNGAMLAAIASGGNPVAARRAARTALDSIEKSESSKKLKTHLGGDAIGTTLEDAFHAMHHQNLPGMQLVLSDFLEKLQSDPEQGLRTVQTGLSRLEQTEFHLERMALLEVLTRIPGQDMEITELAYAEATRGISNPRPDPENARTEEETNLALSTGFDQAVPVVAYNLLLSRVRDEQQAFSVTVDALNAQSDRLVRSNIAAGFVNRYPAHRSEIESFLREKGIAVELPQQGAGQEDA